MKITLHNIRFSFSVMLLLTSLNTTQSYAFSFFYDSDYTKTKYPIVLLHGGLGFDSTNILGVAPMDYWYGIPGKIMRNGGTTYVLQMSAFHSAEVRGEQAIRQLETLMAITGDEKVNLIGHSFGAPTARYVAGVRPDLVASVSTVGGANDTNQRDLDPPPQQDDCDLLCRLINFGGDILTALAGISFTEEKCISDIYSSNDRIREAALTSCEVSNQEYAYSGLPVSVEEGLGFLERAEAFNRVYHWGRPTEFCGEGSELASNGIYYYSWSGTMPFTNFFDPSDAVMIVAGIGSNETDGLVGRCESHWGKVLRDDYPMNHLDETNLLWGLTHPLFEPENLFRTHANRLKKLGL